MKYPDDNDLTNSTAATRVNGYLGGFGKFEDMERLIPDLGLSSTAEKQLLEIGRNRLDSTGALCPNPP